MTDFWLQHAQAISNTLAVSFCTDELDHEGLDRLAKVLRAIQPEGPEHDVFELMYKPPPTKTLNNELRRLLKAIYTIHEITNSEDQSAKWACSAVTGEYRMRTEFPSDNDRSAWLYGLNQVIGGMPDKELHFVDEADSEALRSADRLAYKTYVLGLRLPGIFRKLYPGVEFGKQSTDGSYWGAGVAFVLECGDSLGFEKVNSEMIRKAQTRCKQRTDLIHIDVWY